MLCFAVSIAGDSRDTQKWQQDYDGPRSVIALFETRGGTSVAGMISGDAP
jgi:hypothetical protein